MKDIEETPVAQIIISGLYGVDTFFLMRYFLNQLFHLIFLFILYFSAFLMTVSFLSKLEKNNKLTKFEWAYFYIHRYWR
jgi:hypothetical protein